MHHKPLNPAIKCSRCITVSVQASQHHYCIPRNDQGPYKNVEVLIKNRNGKTLVPKSLKPYTDGYVLAYVPIELVKKYVKYIGGDPSLCDVPSFKPNA